MCAQISRHGRSDESVGSVCKETHQEQEENIQTRTPSSVFTVNEQLILRKINSINLIKFSIIRNNFTEGIVKIK